MGYRIGTLKALPQHSGYYFFLLGDYEIQDRINDFFTHDFRHIADGLGRASAIVEQAKGSIIKRELLQCLEDVLGRRDMISRFLSQFESNNPGLFITNCHPKSLSDGSVMVFIPFRVLEETYSNNNLLYRDIIDFSEGRSKNLINRTSNRRQIFRSVQEHVDIGLQLGIFAINIDP